MSENPIDANTQLIYAEKNLECMLDWNGRYDNKLVIILGINTALLGTLATLAPPFEVWTQIMIIFMVGTVIAFGASYVFLYMGSYPRTSGPVKSLWYFGSISKMKYQEFEKSFLTKDIEGHIIDVLKQIHRNSEILSLKFSYLKLAYTALILGVFSWVITIFLYKTIC